MEEDYIVAINRPKGLALVDGKKIIVIEASVRRDLQLEDADGIDCLPNATIFEQLTLMGKQRPRKPKRKDTEIPQSSVPVENVADEAVYEERDDRDYKSKKRVKKLERKKKSRTHSLKRLYKVGLSARIDSSDDEASLGDQEDASKQERKIHDIDADEDISLENVHDTDMFGVHDLDGDEVFVETEEPVVNAATTTCIILVSAAKDLSDVDMTLAQTLAELKSTKPKAITTTATTTTTAVTRPKAKGLVIQEQEQASWKHFAATRAEEKRNRPPTKAQQRSIICTYLKNMAGWKPKDLKTKSFANVQELFDKAMKREPSKKQEVDDDKETEELKQCMEIISNDGDDVTIKAIPLSTKSPTIIDYKIYKEGKKSYFQIIRADVKERFKKTEPMNYMDTFLHLNLKTIFENHLEDNVWKNQQGLVKVLNWKHYDSYGVHCSKLIMSVKWHLSFLDWSRNRLRKAMYLNEVFGSILLVIEEDLNET
ncbi:hypothetical protein Tco_0696867 [Tanacetum coccineum]